MAILADTGSERCRRRRSRVLLPWALAASLVLAACGGGGGGGGAGGGSTLAAVTITSTQVTVQGDTAVDALSTTDLQLHFSGGSTPTYFLAISFRGTAVSEVQQVFGGGIPDNTVRIMLYRPGQLGAGNYHDTVTLKVCADANCATTFPGSPIAIQVDYTVTGSATPTTTFTLGASVTKFVAFTTDAAAPTTTWILSINDLPLAGVYVRWLAPTGPAIASMDFTQTNCSVNCTGSDWGYFTVTMKPPGSMASGIYSDSNVVDVCFDSACARPLPGSPVTVDVQYTVYAGNGNEYTRQVVPIPAVDVAWNAQDGMLYAVVLPTGTQTQGSITRIDPVTAQAGASLLLDDVPTRLSISNDGQFAYVDLPGKFEVQRVRLADLTSDLIIPMGMNAAGQQVKAARMAVAPGAPHTLAVALQTLNGSEAGGVAVFDDASPRLQALAPLDREFYDSLAWSPDGSQLYVLRSAYPPSLYNLDNVTVSPDGLAIASVNSNLIAQTGYWQYSDLFYDGGHLFTTDAQVFDAATGNKLGSYVLASNPATNATLVADSTIGRTYFMYVDGPSSATILQVFDQATWTSIGMTSLYDPIPSNMHLVRWGTNGLAFESSFGVVLLSGSLVAP